MLEDHANAQADPPQIALAERGDVFAKHLDATAVWLFEPVEAANERRFSCAAAADHAHDLAALDLKRNTVDRRCGAEVLAELTRRSTVSRSAGAVLPIWLGTRSLNRI